jgi:uncharacterized membrane protein YgdD (TMEM256/DUF423 family)
MAAKSGRQPSLCAVSFKRCVADRHQRRWVRTDGRRSHRRMSPNRLYLIAGLLGVTGVILGALGAHALNPWLQQRQAVGLWQTAVLYHLIHTVALLALAGGRTGGAGRLPPLLAAAAFCWIGGVILFSGSLYGLALGAPRALGPITPAGGLALLAGWVLVMLSGRPQSSGPTSS